MQPTCVTFIYADGSESSDSFSRDELNALQKFAGIGQVRDDIVGIIIGDIESGCTTPVLEFANGFCQHTLQSFAPGEHGVTCDFCGEFVRPLNAGDYTGLVD